MATPSSIAKINSNINGNKKIKINFLIAIEIDFCYFFCFFIPTRWLLVVLS
jgi:hypothetical protein